MRQWFADAKPNRTLAPIGRSIGDPRHPTPALVADDLAAAMSGRANYPTTVGIRIALVAHRDDCAEPSGRIVTLNRDAQGRGRTHAAIDASGGVRIEAGASTDRAAFLLFAHRFKAM